MYFEIKSYFDRVLTDQKPDDDIDFGPGPGDTEIKKPEVYTPGSNNKQNYTTNSETDMLNRHSQHISFGIFCAIQKTRR